MKNKVGLLWFGSDCEREGKVVGKGDEVERKAKNNQPKV